MSDFHQDPPRLTNTFEADDALRDLLQRLVPPQAHAALLPQWTAMGEAAAGPLLEMARDAESRPPRHVPWDAWGRRIDAIEMAPGWTLLHREAARWGLTAIPYEDAFGDVARIHQFALLALYGPSSAIYTCHLAMTDGAARTLLEHGGPELRDRVVPRLTTRDPDGYWTSGQWMTERTGGSDVSGTSTVARRGDDGRFRLDGVKWFTSAITSEVALTLARVEGAPAGSAGLSLFYLEQRLADGSRNGITIHRLKDKLGTKALPTAELTLSGAIAEPVGELGRGVKKITPLLNITRLHNAINACGMMARLLQLLRDYARRRVVFGGPLAEKPLHRATLAALQVEYEAALALTFDAVSLLGRAERGTATDRERAVLRLLTPLAKLMTAKQAVAVASEALEGFGGAGYVEDTGLPAWLRDAQVLPIWEGTTNVLSLDVLRAVARDGVLEAWVQHCHERLSVLATGPMSQMAATLERHVQDAASYAQRVLPLGQDAAEAGARAFALNLAAVSAAVALAEQAVWSVEHATGGRAVEVARRWVAARIPSLPDVRTAEARLASDVELSGLAPADVPPRD